MSGPSPSPSSHHAPERAGFLRRHRWAVGAVAVVAVLVAGAGAAVAVEQRRAAEARERADEATAFLTTVLEELGPERVRRNRMEPWQVLDDGVRRVRHELKGRPLLQARLFDALGQVYQDWGLYADARTLIGAGLGLRLRTLGRDHPAVAESRLHLGLLGWELGEAGVDDHFTAAIATYRRHLEAGHPALRRALLAYGGVLRDRGEHARAEALLREVVAPGPASPEPPDATVALALSHLGEILTGRGALVEADSLLREALGARRALHGASHPEVGGVLDALGRVQLARGATETADRAFREALGMRYRLGDPEHPDVAMSLHNLALLERARGNAGDAEWLLRRSLVLAERAFGEGSVESAPLLESLAAVRRELGDAAEAEALYGRALAIWSGRGAHLAHASEARALLGLAELRLARGDAREAEPLFREALAVRGKMLPDGHWQAAEARGALGSGLTALSRLPEAEVHLTEAYETLSRTRGVEDPRTREVLGHLVRLYDGWDRRERGDRYDRFATALRVRQAGAAPR